MHNLSSILSTIIHILKSLINYFIGVLESAYNDVMNTLSGLHINLNFSTSGITNTISSWLNYVNLHFNFLLLDLIPPEAIQFVAPVSLLIAGHVSERHYVGRITVFTNTVALNVFIYYFLQTHQYLFSPTYIITSILLLYANLGFVLGIVALMSYRVGARQTNLFYSITWAYSSIVVGLMIALLTLISY